MEKTQTNTMLNEKEVTNKRVILCYTIILVVLTFSYIIELIKGSREIGYVLLSIALLIIPFLITIFVFIKDKENENIRFFVVIGFSIFYIYILFTSTTNLSFVYALPMMTAITLYRKTKYCIITGTGVTLINLSLIIYKVTSGNYISSDIEDFEIQIACIVLVSAFMTFTAKTINEIFESKMQVIYLEKEKQSEVLDKIIHMTESVKEKIQNIYDESNQMKEKTHIEQSAMEQVAEGTLEVANNVQNQLLMSNEINNLTEKVNKLTSEISEKFIVTKDNTTTGSKNMEHLSKASIDSNNSCMTVQNSIQELSSKIKEVEEILTLIESITSQTSLLSLNASIEAARAGEAGRGFAIVASEIQKLADMTNDATENIKKIVDELNMYNQNVIDASNILSDVNKVQSELITKSKDNFIIIEEEINAMSANVNKQADNIKEVVNSNQEISYNIETISTFTEELTASAESTKALAEENLNSVNNVNELLNQVVEEIKSLVEITK